MSKRNHCWLLAVPLVMLATTLTAVADLTGGSESSELATFDSPAGETFFALSLRPTVSAPAPPGTTLLSFSTPRPAKPERTETMRLAH
jgi:hypothetical protein